MTDDFDNATTRADRLRQRVREALRAGDPTGSWAAVGALLDESDAIQRRAAADRDLARDLIVEAQR